MSGYVEGEVMKWCCGGNEYLVFRCEEEVGSGYFIVI